MSTRLMTYVSVRNICINQFTLILSASNHFYLTLQNTLELADDFSNFGNLIAF